MSSLIRLLTMSTTIVLLAHCSLKPPPESTAFNVDDAPTPSPSSTATPSPSASPAPSGSPTPTPSSSATPTPTPTASTSPTPTPPVKPNYAYSNYVVNLMVSAKCTTCHNQNFTQDSKTNIRLDTYTQSDYRGNPSDNLSRWTAAYNSMLATANPRMPSQYGYAPVSDGDLKIFKDWLDAGIPQNPAPTGTPTPTPTASASPTPTPPQTNLAPEAKKMAVTVKKSGSIPLVLTASDPNGDKLKFTVTAPTHGILSGMTPNLVYTPTPNYVGEDYFEFTVTDPGGLSHSASVCITVVEESTPTADNQSFSVMSNRVHPFVLYGLDKDADKLNFTYTKPLHGTLLATPNGYTYQSSLNYVGPDSFTYTATDPKGNKSATATVSITVTAPPASNYGPVAQNSVYFTNKNRSIAAYAKASDPEKGALTYALVTSPKRGTLSGTLPNLTYTPQANTSGTDSYQYRATDAFGLAAVGTVTINVSANAAPPNYYPTVKSIIDAKCARCHQNGNVPAINLTDYKTVSQAALLIQSVINSKKMPPGQPAADETPNLDMSKFLTPSETNDLILWINGGTPEGDPSLDASTPPAPPRIPENEVSFTVQLPKPYLPKDGDDYQYVTLPIPPSLTRDGYVVAYEVVPGPDVHHILIYTNPPAKAADAASCSSGGLSALVESEVLLRQILASPDFMPYLSETLKMFTVQANQGYKATSLAEGVTGASIGTYVPGTGAIYFPSGTGVKVEAGGSIRLQMHYNTTHNPDGHAQGPDQTSVKFKVVPKVDTEILDSHLSNTWWLVQPDSMLIPAGVPTVTHSVLTDPFALSGDYKNLDSLRIMGTLPHMHSLGKSHIMNIVRANNSRTQIFKTSGYDFNFQEQYFFANPVKIRRGEKIEVICIWDNAAHNQPVLQGVQGPPKDLTWGEDSNDEMCYPSLQTAK